MEEALTISVEERADVLRALDSLKGVLNIA
jgi:hypothetical protein